MESYCKLPVSPLPVDTVESALALDPAEFQAKYGVPKPPLDTPELVFHCQMGRRGGVATDKARGLGFQKYECTLTVMLCILCLCLGIFL